jgi:hypothetical protein
MVLSADDNAQQAVQAVHDDLVMRGIARWTVFTSPSRSVMRMRLAADRLAPLFGGDTDPKDTALAMVSICTTSRCRRRRDRGRGVFLMAYRLLLIMQEMPEADAATGHACTAGPGYRLRYSDYQAPRQGHPIRHVG